MVRQSPRRSKALKEVETPKEEHVHDENVDSTAENVDGSPEEQAPVSSRSARASARESRKKRGGDLRSKSVGLVGKIDTEQTSGKKIVFGEDFTVEDEVQASDETNKNDENDDDDDDDVEEVKASEAKEQVLGKIQQERKAAGVLQKLEMKRKRKVVEEQADDMDEDFFAQVDAELDQERKEKKEQTAVAPKGKRTTFISKAETDYAVEREHNIEVVVLGPEEAVAAASGTKPSQAALLFSRSKLQNGISTIKKTGVSKKKPAKKEGWKRSTKMTRVLISGKRQRRTKPAAHFVIKA
jgi:hypothetical protein